MSQDECSGWAHGRLAARAGGSRNDAGLEQGSSSLQAARSCATGCSTAMLEIVVRKKRAPRGRKVPSKPSRTRRGNPKISDVIDIQLPAGALSPLAEAERVWIEIANAIYSACTPEAVWEDKPADNFLAVSAMRIVQAVSTAMKRGDLKVLRRWELATLKYMKQYAVDEYCRLALHPRTGIDRHIVLGGLCRRISELLGDQKDVQISSEHFALTILAVIGTAIPSLLKGFGPAHPDVGARLKAREFGPDAGRSGSGLLAA